MIHNLSCAVLAALSNVPQVPAEGACCSGGTAVIVPSPASGASAVSTTACGAGVGTGVSFGAAVFCTASVNIADM